MQRQPNTGQRTTFCDVTELAAGAVTVAVLGLLVPLAPRRPHDRANRPAPAVVGAHLRPGAVLCGAEVGRVDDQDGHLTRIACEASARVLSTQVLRCYVRSVETRVIGRELNSDSERLKRSGGLRSVGIERATQYQWEDSKRDGSLYSAVTAHVPALNAGPAPSILRSAPPVLAPSSMPSPAALRIASTP
jgi:hypothetical protein